MTKVKFFTPLMVAAFVAVGYVSYGAYESQSEDDALLLENVEALARGDVEDVYAWSHDIDCPGLFTGDYQVCQEKGPENSCSKPGAVTCDCEKNCD